MRLETERFGTIEIEEDQIYEFKKGIPGFEHLRKFIDIEMEDAPLSFLQSIEDDNLAFLIADPFVFFPNYEFDLSSRVIEELKVTTPEDVLVRCIMTAGESLQSSSLNLVAPIVMNIENRLGEQVVLSNTSYSTKHTLIQPKEDK